MPKKKEKPQPRRWDLARGGVGLAFPRCVEPKPWPQWLLKTFVNIQLLQENPIMLREDLFRSRPEYEWWGIIDGVLSTIEQGAKKVLKVLEENAPAYACKIKEITEDQFWDAFGYENLTPKQANAIAALRSIAVIHSEFFESDKNGYHPYKDADPTTAKMLLEMMLLVLAAIRGELWENVWPKIEDAFKQQRRLQENSAKGVSAINASVVEKPCR